MRRARSKDQENEEVEEIEQSELSEKEQKKLKHKEAIEKRKNAKRKDKVARWGGIILLGLIMFVGFLLWVSGEMREERSSINQRNTYPKYPQESGSIIVR